MLTHSYYVKLIFDKVKSILNFSQLCLSKQVLNETRSNV